MGANATVNTTESAEARAAAEAERHAEPVGHGNTPAAWTLVAVVLLGSLISCIAFAVANVLWFCIGLVVIAVGLLLGGIMRKAGFGVGGSKLKNSGH
ncbi:HGxxPAAW family protein [Arthrobacter castelli]|uniref:HGxxPAAW family protein n=1 Tax=Arthrobacter castelli TaxID=271431 RepID=UPI00040300CB|nr:HGxxPAAW family protein [Arthrobacter castelli]